MIENAEDYREHPRIALFLPDLGMGGAERVFVTLSKYLAQMGYQVDLVLAKKDGPLLKEVAPEVNVVDLAVSRSGESGWLFGLRTLFSLRLYLRSFPPDIMLSTLTGANLTVLVARLISLRKFRLVIREAATLANVKSGLRLRLMRFLYPLADKVVVLTEFMKDEMVKSLRLPVEKIAVIGNPVDCERIRLLAADSDAGQIVDKVAPFAVVVGRLVEQKDFFTAIHAVARVNDERPLNLVVIGDGPQKEELLALARTLNINERVYCLGFQPNPYPWINQADVFILSSKWEGYPNVLLEAMSLGRPIISTEYDASIGVILSVYPARLYRIVSVGNGMEMANAILELTGRDDMAENGGINNIRQVVDKYLLAFKVGNPRQI
ncbi:MAG: glycosyltransferase [Candidatus Thiodiazotropha sp. (ex Dulcina madagascariensis)]|nr:glycosyltransferase [Candidatus Thiodiazotropha sp. (ex Dulcina madagascariensis)]